MQAQLPAGTLGLRPGTEVVVSTLPQCCCTQHCLMGIGNLEYRRCNRLLLACTEAVDMDCQQVCVSKSKTIAPASTDASRYLQLTINRHHAVEDEDHQCRRDHSGVAADA